MKKILLFAMIALFAVPAVAAPTKYWELENHNSFFGGKSQGALILSGGGLLPGLRATKVETKEKLPGLFSTVTQFKSGKVLVGGADAAGLWVVEQEKLRPMCTFNDDIMVTRIVELAGGDALVATLPRGNIYRVKPDGKFELFVKLPVEHVWNLVVVGNTVYAGTGPKAAVYKIDLTSKKASVWWSVAEKHVMAMQFVPKKGLIVGTSPEARVYLLPEAAGSPVARLLYDFSGNEIRDLVVHGETVYAAVNNLQYRTTASSPTQEIKPERETAVPKAPVTAMERKNLPQHQVVSGTGSIYMLGPRGEMEKVLDIARGYFTQLQLEGDRVYGSDGHSGRIYRVETKTFSAAIVVEVEERQVLGFLLKNEKDGFVVAGDGAAAYSLSRDRGKEVTYTSAAMDAGVPSAFGQLHLYASDNALKVETRAGTTEEPDDKLWGPWKAVTGGTRSPDGGYVYAVGSDPARFFQFRVIWNNGSATKIEKLRVFYAPLNLAPKLAEIRVGASRGGPGPYTDPVIPENVPVRSGEVSISWQVVNNDQDPLEYRVWVRKVGEKNWRPLTPRAPVTSTSLTWKALAYADGLYEVRVVASDAPANSPGTEMTSELISKPFLVDNTAPRISLLSIKGTAVTFTASDAASRLIGVQVRVGDDPWKPVLPVDRILDSLTEKFSMTLPATLEKGVHLLQLRVADEAGNVFVMSQEFTY
jgi:hypothetical protein